MPSYEEGYEKGKQESNNESWGCGCGCGFITRFCIYLLGMVFRSCLKHRHHGDSIKCPGFLYSRIAD